MGMRNLPIYVKFINKKKKIHNFVKYNEQIFFFTSAVQIEVRITKIEQSNCKLQT